MDRPMSSHSLSQREGVATATVTTLTQLVQSNWFYSNIQIVTWLASTKHEYNPSYIRNDFCPNTWCTFLICDIFQKYMVNMFHAINILTYIHIFLIFHRFFFFSSCLTFYFLGNSFEKKLIMFGIKQGRAQAKAPPSYCFRAKKLKTTTEKRSLNKGKGPAASCFCSSTTNNGQLSLLYTGP